MIERKFINISRDEMKKEYEKMLRLFNICTSALTRGDVEGFEKDKNYKHNPFIWEIGHVLYFWEVFFYRIINPEKKRKQLLTKCDEIYDSFKVRTNRFQLQVHNKINLAYYYCLINKSVNDWLATEGTKDENYAFWVCLLHTHMHIESFLFSHHQLLGLKSPLVSVENTINSHVVKNNMIIIPNGVFNQGSLGRIDKMIWDNEVGNFKVSIKSFMVSKYNITYGQFREFVKNGGYMNNKYWSDEGWCWVVENLIYKPMYWCDNLKKRRFFNSWIMIEEDHPMAHVNYYEAEAYCNYRGGRLLTESEWEYLAKVGGYDQKKSHLDYKLGNTRSVLLEEENKFGVCGLVGGVWCWCSDPFYPYENFNIDPLYKEFSYPFFGYKNILRGGSWAVPSILTSETYRNAQELDTRIQYTGFRLVMD